MANPRQRRKQKSGTRKVTQSRRQQDKLKKIVVQGPPALVAQWDVKKTARQNYEALGLAHKRPLSLKASGGVEASAAAAQSGSDEELEGAGYTSSEDSDIDDDDQAPIDRPDSTATSKDIPKGFARIERDAQGKILRVVMSAHDLDDDAGALDGSASKKRLAKGKGRQQEGDNDAEEEEGGAGATTTPWGAPLNGEAQESLFEREPESVETSNPALRDLEAATARERAEKPPRFASNGERDTLSKLVKKYKDDTQAMSRDLQLNRDQRTPAQLRKAINRAGGVDKLLKA